MATILQFGERRRTVSSNSAPDQTGANLEHLDSAPAWADDNQADDYQAGDYQAGGNQANDSQRAYFEGLFEQGRQAVDRGDVDAALKLCDEALGWAKEYGDATDSDRATCNRCAVRLGTGRGDVSISDLRMILMRSASPLNRYLAAFNISYYYDLEEDHAKSRFYVEVALDHAKRTESPYNVGFCHLSLGNFLIRESKFADALSHFEKALDLYDESEIYKRLAVLTGMGFCYLATEHFSEGFEKLFTVRRTYIRLNLGASIATSRLRLAFCFGYLELERVHKAILHGKAALQLGKECGDRDVVKKALYLLGEAEKLAGNEMKAFTYFANLQEDFYPDNPMLPEILLYSDTNKLVNVWA